MSPEELRAAIQRLGMTNSGAARRVGADPRSMRRWLSGAVPIPHALPDLIRLMEALPEVRTFLDRDSRGIALSDTLAEILKRFPKARRTLEIAG